MSSADKHPLAHRVDVLERIVHRQDEMIAQLRRELQAFGVELPAINPAGSTQLSPQALHARRQVLAARARAAKPVDPDAAGRAALGSVRSEETRERLESEAEELARRVRGDF